LFGEFRPNWRRWWCCALGMCAYLTFGLFQIQALGMEHSMEINKPFIEDTFLTWYVGGPLIALPFMLGLALCWEYGPGLYKKLVLFIKKRKDEPDASQNVELA